ncbi:MAG: 50S ribosomal protein L14e [Nanoarchaeota archaeon]|nr:50S ribosomal protein L14e [Nanoarchaeota archaeon]
MSKELIGRICYKTAGKEANKIAVIIDKIDNNFVLIDGNVKRRKCNILHLELTDKKLDLKKKDPTEIVHKAMKQAKIKITEKKEKKETKPKPTKKRKTKEVKKTEENKDKKKTKNERK